MALFSRSYSGLPTFRTSMTAPSRSYSTSSSYRTSAAAQRKATQYTYKREQEQRAELAKIDDSAIRGLTRSQVDKKNLSDKLNMDRYLEKGKTVAQVGIAASNTQREAQAAIDRIKSRSIRVWTVDDRYGTKEQAALMREYNKRDKKMLQEGTQDSKYASGWYKEKTNIGQGLYRRLQYSTSPGQMTQRGDEAAYVSDVVVDKTYDPAWDRYNKQVAATKNRVNESVRRARGKTQKQDASTFVVGAESALGEAGGKAKAEERKTGRVTRGAGFSIGPKLNKAAAAARRSLRGKR